MLGNFSARRGEASDTSQSTCRGPSAFSPPLVERRMSCSQTNGMHRESSPDLSLKTVRYMSSSSRYSSDDTLLEEEAQSLLSQFMKSPHQDQELSKPETVVHADTFHRPLKRTANGDIKLVKTQNTEHLCTNESDSNVLSPRWPPTHTSSAWQQHDNDGPPALSTNTGKIASTATARSWSKTSSAQQDKLSFDNTLFKGTRSHTLSNMVEAAVPVAGKPHLHPMGSQQDLRGLHFQKASGQHGSSFQERVCKPKPSATHKPRGLAARRSRRSVPAMSSEQPKSAQDHRIISKHRYAMAHGVTHTISDNMSMLLRSREIGCGVSQRIQNRTADGLKLAKSWKGASNDVIVLAWSDDDTRFAVGAAAQCDEHNMQYNRGNNLVLGDLVSNSLKELPDHRIPRPLPAISGTVSQHATYNTVDPYLYMSVSAVQWFENTLFTASYDNTVKLWDVSSHSGAACLRTLRHESKVQVMARSNFNENLLATGTQSIGIWNIGQDDATYIPLNITRKSPSKDIDLIPTSIAWGTTIATKTMLAAGMSGKDPENGDTSREGHLAVWRVSEASIVSEQVSPNSQNIFDVTWHPTLPSFATGSSAPVMRNATMARDTRSVIRVYEPLRLKRCAIEFDCPALDINDVTFCPMDTNYLTASCTDGVTYVWDHRRPSEILHRLQHGGPLNQLDENLTREQADVGVRMALWGDSLQRFYTGGSDGVLKTWNILQSPEDVHVHDVVSLGEEIMCAAFSKDKTNLLIGDAAGGIRVLSSGPFADTGDRCMGFERTTEPSHDIRSDPESGVETADQLLSSGQLMRHPVYGVGQGPHYSGPYAAWARPPQTPSDQLSITPLTEDIQALQLEGPPVEYRDNLDAQSRKYVDAQIELARIRNQRRNGRKRKREASASTSWTMKITIPEDKLIDLCSDEEGSFQPSLMPTARRRHAKQGKPGPIITQMATAVIDLTEDTDSEQMDDRNERALQHHVEADESGDTEQLLETLDEDYWWPDSSAVDANIHALDA